NGCPPLRAKGPSLAGGKAIIDCSKSSQFLSSVLVAAPYAKEDVELEIIGELRSKPFIDMTIQSMNDFGIDVENHNYERFVVKAGQKYEGRDYNVEGDYTNASYFFAAAAITGGKVKVKNLNPHSVQGDLFLLDILERMGCKVRFGDNFAELEGGKLNGIEVDMSDYPDVVQTLAVVAAFASGRTKIRNIAHLRIKETDRIAATAIELRKLGADVIEENDSLTVFGGIKNGASIETYNDHRMAMAFAVAGLMQEGIIIKDVECVNKSFPNYFEELAKMGD
ncbi:MAG: 3-phosphoshikimate 1-carboxyvinyltransferase, partial [Candidatus Diapherotrites archaeon]